MTTTMERMDMSAETPELSPNPSSEIEKEWLEIAEKLLIQIALNKYKREEAALKLGMSLKTLLKRRHSHGLVKYPALPSHDEIHELLELLPRTAIETYLLKDPIDA